MSDFDFNEHVQENAGYYGAVGGMMALRNQQKQSDELRKQRTLLEKQAKAAEAKASAEQERLEIQKQQLELEKQEQELRRQEAEQVKEMRKLMAGISSELDELNAALA